MDQTNRLPWLIATVAIMFALMVLIRSETAQDRPAVPVVAETPRPQRKSTLPANPERTKVPDVVSKLMNASPVLDLPQSPAVPHVTNPPSTPDYSMAGKVVDSTGKPVARVTVRGTFTSDNNRGEVKAVTDSGGKFVLSKIQAAELETLTFEARGFSSNVMNKVPLPLPEELIVELTPVAGIDLGIVKSDSPDLPPKPFTGNADITLFQRRNGESGSHTLGIAEPNISPDSYVPVNQQTAVAVQGGTHAIENVEPGNYKIGVSSVGSYAESLPITVAAGARTTASVTMGVQWTVSGRVLNDDKKPVSQANVELIGSGTSPSGGLAQHTGFTDSDGRFVLPEVMPGSFKVTVSALGFTTVTSTLKVEMATPPPASEFVLARQEPALHVAVLDAEGKPVLQARLVLMLVGEDPPRTFFGKTDETGNYRFEKLASGNYSLAVTAPEERSRQKSMQVALNAGEFKAVQVQFGKQVRVTGRVKRGGKAYSGLLAFALRGTVGMETMVKVDENGGFAADMESGEYMVGPPEDPRSDVATVPPGDTAQLEISIK